MTGIFININQNVFEAYYLIEPSSTEMKFLDFILKLLNNTNPVNVFADAFLKYIYFRVKYILCTVIKF